MAGGLLIVKELLPVEGVILLIGHVFFVPLPQGDHGVEGIHLGVLLVLRGLVLLFLLLRLLLGAGLGDLHADGVADIIGVLPNQLPQLVLLQEPAVFLILGVSLQLHDDVGTGGLPLGRLHGVSVGTAGLPHPGLLGAVPPGNHCHRVGHHKSGVEAHAELADDVNRLLLVHLLFKIQRAGFADGAQILLHLLFAHAYAVVGDGEDPMLGVPLNGDSKIVPVEAHLFIGEGLVSQLVHGVRGVGDDLPEENLLVGVNGVDH